MKNQWPFPRWATALLLLLASCAAPPQPQTGELKTTDVKPFSSRADKKFGVPVPFLLRDMIALLYPESGLMGLYTMEGESLRSFNIKDSTEHMISVPAGVVSFDGNIGVLDSHYETLTLFSPLGRLAFQTDLSAPLHAHQVAFNSVMILNTSFQQAAGDDLYFPVQRIDSAHLATKFSHKGIIARLGPDLKLKGFVGSFPASYSGRQYGATTGFFFTRQKDDLLVSYECTPEILVFDAAGEAVRSFGVAPEGWVPPAETQTLSAYMEHYIDIRNHSFLFQHIYCNPFDGDIFRIVCLPSAEQVEYELPLPARDKLLQQYDSEGNLIGSFKLPKEVLYLTGFTGPDRLKVITYNILEGTFSTAQMQIPG